jgi:phospholipid/cholesterol/gamma-HCH transport system substrate-binding protein
MKLNDPRLSTAVFLGATALVFGGLVAMSKYPELQIFKRGREYKTVFNNVTGLNQGDEVRYGGLLVGAVTRLAVDSTDPTKLVVTFRVRRNTPVHVDTRATITQVGLLGEPFLNLQPGSQNVRDAPEGYTIPGENSLTFQQAMTQLAVLGGRADTLLTAAIKVAKADPVARLESTLARLDQLIINTSQQTERVVGQLERTSTQLGQVLSNADRVLASVDTVLRTSGPGLDTTQREALSALRETRTLLAELREGLNEAGGVDHVMRNLAQATDNLARLSARIERDPTSVFQRRASAPKPAGPSARD